MHRSIERSKRGAGSDSRACSLFPSIASRLSDDRSLVVRPPCIFACPATLLLVSGSPPPRPRRRWSYSYRPIPYPSQRPNHPPHCCPCRCPFPCLSLTLCRLCRCLRHACQCMPASCVMPASLFAFSDLETKPCGRPSGAVVSGDPWNRRNQ